MRPGRADVLLALVLALSALAPYWQVRGHEFVAYDDTLYVTQNARVQGGLTLENAAWGLTTLSEANWHPATWWSHMLDWSLFGAGAGGHHLTSALLHALNTALLFAVLLRLTGARWRSALVAALFALHPLNVESVAWVGQRKTVLSAAFGFLALWSWAAWVARRTTRDYVLATLWFAASLMAKPMLVTLPCLLLVLDWWPLGRLRRERPWRLVVEKLPFFALAAADAVVTYLAQYLDEAVKDAGPLPARLASAVMGYVEYLRATVWPAGLAPLYPRPPSWPPAQVAAAAAVLAAITAVAVATRRRAPHLLAGWLWYLGTLVPMIGLVQVGLQSHADRYAYFPLIGVFVMIAWSLPERPLLAVVPGVAAVLLTLATLTWSQVGLWRDSRTLFAHTVAVTADNPVMQHNLAEALRQAGELDAAIAHDEEAVRLDPGFWGAWNSLGVAYAARGRVQDATGAYERALAAKPDLAAAHGNLAGLLARQGRLDQALGHARDAVRLEPAAPDYHYLLGLVLAGSGDRAGALAAHEEALARDPSYVPALAALAEQQVADGRRAEAVATYRRLVPLAPSQAAPRHALASLLLADPHRTADDLAEALPLLERASELTDRRNPHVLDTLAVAYAMSGQLDRALDTGATALTLAQSNGDTAAAAEIEAHLARFRELQAAPAGSGADR